MHAEYSSVRTGVAIPKGDLRQIDAAGSGQKCSKFGVHPQLKNIQTLYNDEDLLWVSNMGVLQEPTAKDNWWEKTGETSLFAHNIQSSEVHNMDIFEAQSGRGVGGRMIDALVKNGYNADTISAHGIADFLVSSLGAIWVVEQGETALFDPMSSFGHEGAQDVMLNNVKDLNKATNLGSGEFDLERFIASSLVGCIF